MWLDSNGRYWKGDIERGCDSQSLGIGVAGTIEREAVRICRRRRSSRVAASIAHSTWDRLPANVSSKHRLLLLPLLLLPLLLLPLLLLDIAACVQRHCWPRSRQQSHVSVAPAFEHLITAYNLIWSSRWCRFLATVSNNCLHEQLHRSNVSAARMTWQYSREVYKLFIEDFIV